MIVCRAVLSPPPNLDAAPMRYGPALPGIGVDLKWPRCFPKLIQHGPASSRGIARRNIHRVVTKGARRDGARIAGFARCARYRSACSLTGRLWRPGCPRRAQTACGPPWMACGSGWGLGCPPRSCARGGCDRRCDQQPAIRRTIMLFGARWRQSNRRGCAILRLVARCVIRERALKIPRGRPHAGSSPAPGISAAATGLPHRSLPRSSAVSRA